MRTGRSARYGSSQATPKGSSSRAAYGQDARSQRHAPAHGTTQLARWKTCFRCGGPGTVKSVPAFPFSHTGQHQRALQCATGTTRDGRGLTRSCPRNVWIVVALRVVADFIQTHLLCHIHSAQARPLASARGRVQGESRPVLCLRVRATRVRVRSHPPTRPLDTGFAKDEMYKPSKLART